MLEKPKPKLPKSELIRFQTAISSKRLQSYREHPGEQDLNLMSTHFWNTTLSESLYPVLHNCEIAIRNNFNRSISKLLDNEGWLLEQNGQILNEQVNKHGKEKVESAIKKIEKKKKIVTNDNLIAELDFGFWISLSWSTYEQKNNRVGLYPRLFSNPDFFPHLARSERKRKTLSDKLTLIGKLRNKIFHHNCIWNKEGLDREYDTALEIIQWVSPIMYESTKQISRFPKVYEQGKESCIEMIRNFTGDDFLISRVSESISEQHVDN